MRTTDGSGTGGQRGWRRFGLRQGEEEGHAALGKVLGPDASPVGLDDPLANRQPESRAASSGWVPAIELVEHLVFLARRQSGTTVGDFDGDGTIGRGGDDRDRA